MLVKLNQIVFCFVFSQKAEGKNNAWNNEVCSIWLPNLLLFVIRRLLCESLTAFLMIKKQNSVCYRADIFITCRDKQIQPISLTLRESHMSEKHPQIVACCVVEPQAPPVAMLIAVSIPAVAAVNHPYCDKLIAIGTCAWPPGRTFLLGCITLSDQPTTKLS